MFCPQTIAVVSTEALPQYTSETAWADEFLSTTFSLLL
jgi:hypothetical protein